MHHFHHIKAVIIDLDGTMVDTAPDFLVAINHMLVDLSLPVITIDHIKQFVGKGTENLLRKVLGLYYAANDIDLHYDTALPSYMQHYTAINGQHAVVYPGVSEGLTVFKQKGLHVICLTNKPLAFATPLLEQKGLLPFFEAVYGGDSFAEKKPSPLPMRTICQSIHVKPNEVVAIGDSSNDAIAAKAAGCYVFNVPYGYNHGKSVHDLDSDGIVTTLLEAANLIN